MNQNDRMVIEQAKPDEHEAIRALVEQVARETFASDIIPRGRFCEEDWSRSWIAILNSKMAGVVLTHEEWVSDLWVLAEYRGRGVGEALLLRGESEIAACGHRIFRLRVVKSNVRAIHFYQRRGWMVEREFPHETLPTIMLEMSRPAL